MCKLGCVLNRTKPISCVSSVPCNRIEVFPCRYERSQKQAAFGRSLVQRHVALPEDLANEAGEGLLVRVNSSFGTFLGVLNLHCYHV